MLLTRSLLLPPQITGRNIFSQPMLQVFIVTDQDFYYMTLK